VDRKESKRKKAGKSGKKHDLYCSCEKIPSRRDESSNDIVESSHSPTFILTSLVFEGGVGLLWQVLRNINMEKYLEMS